MGPVSVQREKALVSTVAHGLDPLWVERLELREVTKVVGNAAVIDSVDLILTNLANIKVNIVCLHKETVDC